MQIVISILLKILMSMASEEVIKPIIATCLEWLVKSTKNNLDNDIARPVIDKLRS